MQNFRIHWYSIRPFKNDCRNFSWYIYRVLQKGEIFGWYNGSQKKVKNYIVETYILSQSKDKAELLNNFIEVTVKNVCINLDDFWGCDFGE